MHHDWWVAEILGEPIEPASKTELPSIPVLEADAEFRKGAADSLCRKLETETITNMLVGPHTDVAALPTPLAKAAPIADFGKFLRDTIKFTERARQLDMGESQRKADLRKILLEHVGKFAPNPDAIDRVVQSAAKWTRAVLMEANV